MEFEPYYDREELVHLTTHTVQHNLIEGMVLVTLILLMFLNNVRSALIVAINIPLGVVLRVFRPLSARQIGEFAVHRRRRFRHHRGFGRHHGGKYLPPLERRRAPGIPLKQRIFWRRSEIDKALFFSTAIMVCAFIPLFTMSGAEGELFGPMAQTYAFALGGALFWR